MHTHQITHLAYLWMIQIVNFDLHINNPLELKKSRDLGFNIRQIELVKDICF